MIKRKSQSENKQRFFYGWYIVMGLATISMVSVGMGGMNLGLFIEPMNREIDISYMFFGLSQTARIIGFSLSSWLIGRILDRYGARVPMAMAAAFMGMIMLGMSMINHGWQLVALIFLSGMIGLEGGGGNLYQSVPLSRWFIKKRGKAMSLAFLGATAGIFIFTPLLQFVINQKGWRFAWLSVGGTSCFIIFLVAIIIIRKDPNNMGLHPDGEIEIPGIGNNDTAGSYNITYVEEYSWTRAQAIRSFSFWGLAIMNGFRMLSLSTLNVYRIPYYIEVGVDAQLVAWAISFEAVVSALIAFPTGWAMDRFQPRFVTAVTLMGFILVFIVTLNVKTTAGVFVATALFGLSAASTMVAQNALWPAYFGSKHIGSIRGMAVPLTALFGALGAPVTGWIKDKTGSFSIAWISSIIFLSIAIIIILFNKKPDPPVKVIALS